ncbi:MAG: DUF4118 domain-containing protein, partial [Pseudomonadota bacterium]|nr:DUF4118 domain-containing protein [Pseudomonadota bacterium]
MRAPFSDPDRIMRWATAVALAALAVALQWSVRPWIDMKIPFLFFLPAIVATAARCGRGAGYFVTGVGFCSAVLWLVPPGGWWVVGVTDELSLLIYSILGVLLATLGARLHLTSARASAAEQRLVLAGEDMCILILDLDLE